MIANPRGVYAIYRFEMARFGRTLMTSLLMPVITTSLYFIVFGSAIGSRIIARMLDRDPDAVIDCAWLTARLTRALAHREVLFDAPFYRLVHAEADGPVMLSVTKSYVTWLKSLRKICVAQM